MKVLILSCNTGGGHNSCAQAIQQSLQSRGDSCDIVDSLGFCSGKLSKFMSWGHSTMYRRIPGLFRFGYGFAERHPGMLKDDAAAYKLLTGGTEELRQLLLEKEYDAVICTHVFSGLLLRETLLRFPMQLKTAFVATDYTCSPGAAKSDLDLYFIPAESLREEFISQGVPLDRIVASGIPVRPEFYESSNRNSAKKALGIDPSRFHILVTCGSMGCGPMEHLAKQLHVRMPPSCEISIVCGRNEQLYKQMATAFQGKGNVHVYGYVKDMNTLMDSADLCVTKPGGLSTSEAAVKRLPMVLLDVVSGCEERNLNFFLKCGGAVSALGVDGVVGRCLVLAKEPETLERMRNALAMQFPDNATEIISGTMHALEDRK